MNLILRQWFAALAAFGLVVPAVVGEPADKVPLQVSSEAPFDTQGYRLFSGGFQCDALGRVTFTPMEPNAKAAPSLIVRVSADGKQTSSVNAALPLQSGKATVTLNSIATDPDGQLHALLGISKGREGLQAIAWFDDDGRMRSRLDLDPDMAVHRFAVFRSGDYLLIGRRWTTKQFRLEILPVGGGSAVEVSPPSPTSAQEKVRWFTGEGSFAVPAADGRVYFAPDGNGPIYAIGKAGDIVGTFELAPPVGDARLIDLKVSSGRLAAVFRAGQGTPMEQWITVLDLATGGELATYGPVRNLVMCYRVEGSRDWFSLLGAKNERMMVFQATAAP